MREVPRLVPAGSAARAVRASGCVGDREFAEGIPVVLMEAMAIEIACIATRITGVPELIRNELNGVLMPPGGEVELARALGRLMDDSDLRLRVAESARQRVLKHYDLNRNVEAGRAI